MTSLFSSDIAWGVGVDVIVTESSSKELCSTEFLVRFEFSVGKKLLCSSLGVNRTCDWRATSLAYPCIPPRLHATTDLNHPLNSIGEIGIPILHIDGSLERITIPALPSNSSQMPIFTLDFSYIQVIFTSFLIVQYLSYQRFMSMMSVIQASMSWFKIAR